LQRAAKLFQNHGLLMSAFAACAVHHRDEGFVALVRIGNTSHHSLVLFLLSFLSLVQSGEK